MTILGETVEALWARPRREQPIRSGEDYIESLRGRNLAVHYMGAPVGEPVDHPVIRPSINALARTYDLALEQPDLATAYSAISDRKVNRFLHVAMSAEDVVAQNRMQRTLGQQTGTCFQRCVGMDALNTLFSITFDCDAARHTGYHERFRSFLRYVQEENFVIGGAMTDPKGDRSKGPAKQADPDVFLHVVERREDGVVLRGAKAHQTGCVNSHWIVVMPTMRMREADRDYAIVAAIPVEHPGLRFVYGRQSSDSRALEGVDQGNAQFAGQEALIIIDDVFVPNEYVFLDGEVEYAAPLVDRFTGFHRRSYVCKTGLGDVIIGASAQLAEWNGVAGASHIGDKLVEMVHLNETIYGAGIAASYQSTPTAAGSFEPDPLLANVCKQNVTRFPYELGRLAQDIAGGIVATMPSELDFDDPDTGPLLRKYFATAPGIKVEDRMRLLRLVENMTMGRNAVGYLTESLHGAGSPQAQRITIARLADIEEKKSLACHLAGVSDDAKSPSRGRPWTKLYSAGCPADITQDYRTMLDLFNASVRRAPDNVAIKYFNGVLTMADLDARSDALAVALVDHGFAAGDRLGVYVQNNPAFVISLLAAWKAGGAALLINPMNKRRELAYVLADSGASALVCLDDLYESVAKELIATGETAVRTVITCSPLDEQSRNDERLFAGMQRLRPGGTLDLEEIFRQYAGRKSALAHPGPEDLAVLCYTSGTTGEPKGAMCTHAAMAFNSQTYRDWMGFTAEDSVLGVAPLFHITGLIGHMGVALLVGCPLVISHRFQSDVIMDSIREHRPTFTIGSITVFINLSGLDGTTKEDWSSFRIIYSGGASIPPAVTDQFREKTGIYIHNLYGLTETNSPSHTVPMTREAPVDPNSGALSVGVPVFNTVVRILDEEGHEVPVGQNGQLAISGPEVIHGYWNKPAATAESLPGGELLTGDIGFMDADGWFYIVDRKKDMINASGYKVWPHEIEDVIYGHPAVREAAVVGVPDAYRGETVKAYVSLKPGTAVTEQELIGFCKEQMAAYKYPRSIEFLDDLPKTASGKILRRELRDLNLKP